MSLRRAGPRSAPPPRLVRRRRLLGWSAPVVLLALLVAAWLLGLTVGNLHARTAYDAGDHATAAERYAYQQRWSPILVEPWKAWFNSGTAELRAGERFPATEQLRGALERVPPGTTDAEGRPAPGAPECRVRTNLSLALEAMGDEAAGQDDPGMAEAYYTEAMDVVGPCSSDGESEAQAEEPEEPETRQDTDEQRQRGKRDEAVQEQQDGAEDQQDQPEQPPGAEQPPEDPDAAPEPPEDGTPGDPRLEELQERNREAERERSEEQQERGGGSPEGQNW